MKLFLKQNVFRYKIYIQRNWMLIIMIKADERRLLHKYLLLELAVKSLQSDYQKAVKTSFFLVFTAF